MTRPFNRSARLLTRWTADTYAADESSFFKALVQQVTTTGVANLEARTGQPWATLLGQWALAVAADHYAGLANAPGIPSWNTRDVFQGLYDDQENVSSAYPLSMSAYSAAPISVAAHVAAGSATFFDLTFPTAKQSIAIAATTSSELPRGTTLRLAVVRVQ